MDANSPHSQPEEPGPPSHPVSPAERRFDLSPRNLIIFNLLFWATVYTTWSASGPWYCICAMLILGSHEFAHYLACRRNNVDSSLPNFLPAPFLFPLGTFGAFILMKEPIPDRRALMEIGASGPIAGFLVALPILFWGIALSEVQPPGLVGGMELGDSLLILAASKLILGVTSLDSNVTILIHPIGYAGWFGVLLTSMNLLPIGQLDGGHVLYSLFPDRHVLFGRLFLIVLLILGFFWPGWFLLGVILFLIGFRHPPILERKEELSFGHRMMGFGCILIFLITFIPIPIEVGTF